MHQELHGGHKKHEHDEIVRGDLDKRVCRVAIRELAPYEHTIAVQGAAARMMQPAIYWSASAGVMNGANRNRKKAHANSAIEKGLTTQLTKSVTTRPVGRRPTFFTAEKSTFIIIGVIISQMSTAMGMLI